VLQSRSVLTVDDNATNQRIMDLQLEAWGMTAVAASGAAEALKLAAQRPFDVALIDLQMPDVDGVELARQLRRLRPGMPLLLLSSSGHTETGEAASLFRFQLLKPIKQSALLDALQQAMGLDARRQAAPERRKLDREMGVKWHLRILLAEDNAVNQKVGLMMLAGLGYHADLAANGAEAVEAARRTGYDVIFMDIQMPEMDGIEAFHRIQEKAGGKKPFVVALTANALEGDREKFLALGFDGYLSKPLQPDRLEGALRSVPGVG
jgi:CheY-like chemotaxis protein